MPTITMNQRREDVRTMTPSTQQAVAVELAGRACARSREGKRWAELKNLVRLALVTLLASGCGFGSAIGGTPEIARHEYPKDGVVCYVATGYGPRNYEVSISCVKTKEAP